MQLTITEAAKLYRKQRKTLYRHIDSSRLSCTVRGDGHRVIDLSELMRVYGNPPGPMPTDDPQVTRGTPQSDTLLTQAMLDELRALRQEVKELREVMLRLPAPERPTPMAHTPPERPETPAQGRSVPPPTQPKPEGTISFADIEARMLARIKGQS